jgi:hypothetical protein
MTIRLIRSANDDTPARLSMSDNARLRPMSLGELLGASWRLLRRQAILFVSIAALVQAPVILAQVVFNMLMSEAFQHEWEAYQRSVGNLLRGGIGMPFRMEPILWFQGGSLFLFGLNQIAVGMIYAVIAYAITLLFDNQNVAVRSVLQAGRKRLVAAAGAGVISYLIVIGVIAVIYAGSFFGWRAVFIRNGFIDRSRAVIATLVSFGLIAVDLLLALIMFALVFVRLQLSSQAIGTEGLGSMRALRRSWTLVRHAHWRTLGMLILLIVLTGLVIMIPGSIITAIINAGLGAVGVRYGIQQGVSSLIIGVLSVLTAAYASVVWTLYYIDLRVRQEAYDLPIPTPAVVSEIPSGA